MNDTKNSMQIYVTLKHIGNIRTQVTPHPFLLGSRPHTFRELIEESVKSCIVAYRDRARNAENPLPLTDEQWDGMREVGKFAFGVHYNENGIDENMAVATAIDTVKDGLVRVFIGTEELINLDGKIDLSEDDVLTFVRLTMLSGRMW